MTNKSNIPYSLSQKTKAQQNDKVRDEMAGLIHDLIEVLNQQKECYEGLLTLARYKTDSIVNREMELLEEVLKREQEFMGRSARLEKNRETILKDISSVLNTNLKDLTISKLITMLEKTPDEQEKLRQVREDLLGIVEELKNHNRTNEGLLQQSMEFINFTLNALQSMNTYSPGNYQDKGNESEHESVSFFDTKQ